MLTSSNPPARQPRKRPAPSQRDQQIYLDYQVTGKRQIDLAEQYNLTQCRISQVIRRVEKWLHRGAGVSPAEMPPLARGEGDERSETGEGTSPHSAFRTPQSAISPNQFDYQLEFQRLNFVSREAIRHFQQQQVTVTHKNGERADKKFDETTRRHHPPSIQCLKVVLQANAQFARLRCRERPLCRSEHRGACGSRSVPQPVASPSPTTAPKDDAAHRDDVEAWLTEQRTGKVAYNPNNHILVHDFVSTLLGESENSFALHVLAREAGKKVVDRRPYDDSPPPLPPHDGWYYAMYDANGGLVAWLTADQLKGAISPDYPPLRGAGVSPASFNPERAPSRSDGRATAVTSADNAPPNTHSPLTPLTEPSPTAHSSTSAPAADSLQPQPLLTLAPLAPPTQTSLPPEIHPPPNVTVFKFASTDPASVEQ